MKSPKTTLRNLQAAALAAGLVFCCASARQVMAADVQLAFHHQAGADRLIYDSLRYENQSGEQWSVTRLSYLVSDVGFQREDGTWFTLNDSVGWMNAASRRQAMVLQGVPAGK